MPTATLELSQQYPGLCLLLPNMAERKGTADCKRERSTAAITLSMKAEPPWGKESLKIVIQAGPSRLVS